MRRALRWLADWWFAPAPAERLAVLRIAIGAFALGWVVYRTPELVGLTRLPATYFKPVGVVTLLEGPLQGELVMAIAIATAVLLLAFTLGVGYRVTAPLAAAGLLWTLSYRNSWGMPFHTENLLVLHVIALACAPAADVWAIGRRRADPPATYVLAGIAKLRIAGLGWIDGELLRNQIAIDNLRKALLGDPVAPLATLFLEHPSALTVFCGLTLVLELGAPVALAGGRLARMWAAGAWGFHLGVVLLMNIWFPYPLFGFAYLPLLRAERPFSWLIGRWRRRPPAAGNAPPV
jgi:uncharacterized membrane protein YphA (DoxX/SURF4 family)